MKTTEVYQRELVAYRQEDRLFEKSSRSVGMECDEFWHQVAFTNLVIGSIGATGASTAKQEQCKECCSRLRGLLAKYAPKGLDSRQDSGATANEFARRFASHTWSSPIPQDRTTCVHQSHRNTFGQAGSSSRWRTGTTASFERSCKERKMLHDRDPRMRVRRAFSDSVLWRLAVGHMPTPVNITPLRARR